MYKILAKDKVLDEFPLFAAIHEIAFGGAPPESLIAKLSSARPALQD